MRRSLTKKLVPIVALAAWLAPGGVAATGSGPECVVDVEHADARVGSAGCLVVRERRLLLVRHGQSGKLTFPAGYAEAGESAQCTAHRETWEETGIEVRVGELVKVFPNGFHLYSCDLQGVAAQTSGRIEVPVTAAGEVREVLWVDAVTLRAEDWRFPEFFADVKSILASHVR